MTRNKVEATQNKKYYLLMSIKDYFSREISRCDYEVDYIAVS